MQLTLFMVMSIDGIVALDEETDIREYSSPEDREFFIRETSAFDAAIMGRFSYNEEVACRRKYVLSHREAGSCGDENTILLCGDAREICSRIEADGNERVALLGGPRTNTAFLGEGFVDELYLTVEPVVLGRGLNFADEELRAYWTLRESIRLNEKGTIVNHYVRKKGEGSHSDTGEKLSERWRAILENPLFAGTLKGLEAAEADRIFCGHGITHLLDTARVMYIMDLEEGLYISKDIVYAAGLLHDMGRLREYEEGIPHEKACIPIAGRILSESGYTKEESDLILNAIASHRGSGLTGTARGSELAGLLYRADKGVRLCFRCEAREECNWSEERKNTLIGY